MHLHDGGSSLVPGLAPRAAAARELPGANGSLYPAEACATVQRPWRLAAVTSHPIQYHVPLFRLLAAHRDIDLTVFFTSRTGLAPAFDRGFGREVAWDIPLTKGYNHCFVRSINLLGRSTSPIGLLPPALPWFLWHGRFDAVLVHSYATLASVVSLLAANALGIRVLLRTESVRRPRPWPVRILKRLFLTVFLAGTSARLAIGKGNRDFYSQYGGRGKPCVFWVPYAVENERFAVAAGVRATVRHELGFAADRCVVLFCGKLIPRKRPLDVVRALVCLPNTNVSLLIVGDGELRGPLLQAARASGIDFRFLGFVNQSALPRVYAAADIFTLPSEFETWGLVVNEAMAAGLPVVVSRGAGCTPDLVREGENGTTFEVGDISALAEGIRRLAGDASLRAAWGRLSREIVGQYSYAKDVEGVVAALRAVAPRLDPVAGAGTRLGGVGEWSGA